MVTHDPDIASRARRVLHIKDGRIVSDERKSDEGRVKRDEANRNSGKDSSLVTRHSALTFAEFREFAGSAIRAISANKVRSVLSMLGILIGVASVIAMLAIGKGAQKAIEARLAWLGSNVVMLFPGAPNMRGVQAAMGSVSGSR